MTYHIQEWRSLGVQQSRGWVHYELHKPEPHILLFRRPKGSDPTTGLPPANFIAPSDTFVYWYASFHHTKLLISSHASNTERLTMLHTHLQYFAIGWMYFKNRIVSYHVGRCWVCHRWLCSCEGSFLHFHSYSGQSFYIWLVSEHCWWFSMPYQDPFVSITISFLSSCSYNSHTQ